MALTDAALAASTAHRTVANIERQPVPPVSIGGTKAVSSEIVERLFDIVSF